MEALTNMPDYNIQQMYCGKNWNLESWNNRSLNLWDKQRIAKTQI